MGSEAYKEAQDIQGQKENDLRLQAASQGIGLDQGARQQALSEQTSLRELPLNEISALLGASQVQTPQFQGYQGSQVQASPLFGATQAQGQNAGDIYNAQMAARGNMYGGLFSLGGTLGAAALLSDRRLKTDIREVGKYPSGIPIYLFRYKWSKDHILGVMADEVEKLIPEAIHFINGFKLVNYAMVH